jgi:hypothetical protein
MKHLLSVAALLLTGSAIAQPRVVKSAIVKMQTEITFPENFGGPGGGGPPGGGDGGGNTVIMGGPGGMEANSTLYYTVDRSKLESTSDFGNNIVISDRKEKKTTTLIEAMGKKTGFYSTEEDEAAMRNRMDSARNARRDSLQKMGLPIAAPAKPEIVYTEETKKIAGYTCKKALIRTKDRQGTVNESTVWYCPEFKMGEGFSFGGGRGGFMGGPMMGGMNGLENIDGFPMEYSMSRNNGMKMHMTVSKVQLDAAIDDKTFEVPKGFELKSMKDMQGRDGRMMIRIGGPGSPGGPNN